MDRTHQLTKKVVIALLAGFLVGFICIQALAWFPAASRMHQLITLFSMKLCYVLGQIFMRLLKLLVVPIVLVSLLSGIASLDHVHQFGRIGLNAFLLYLATTISAVILALCVASIVHVGMGYPAMIHNGSALSLKAAPPITQTLIQFVPDNFFAACTKGSLVQIIVFCLLFGVAILRSGPVGKKMAASLQSFQVVLNEWVMLILSVTPLGVFCLVTNQVVHSGWHVILPLFGYFSTVLGVLCLHFLLIYGLLITCFSPYKFIDFVKKISPAMLFAFGTASSNASLPVTLKIAEDQLQIKKLVRSFVIPLGATMNMDGTVIMQAVATVFLINVYHMKLALLGYVTIIVLATIASVGAAGVPSAGLITLMMVLQQLGIPLEGIAMIIGVDRLLDMARTAMNVSGDLIVATVINSRRKV
jgi:Na+/H+-dicarboxylate symporter